MPAPARSVNAAAADGFASRSACVQRQLIAIGLDAFERRRGDPGQAGVAARVARLARYDRRPEHGEVDRAARARNCQRGADVDAERIRKAALEHDPALAERRTCGRHRHVHGRAPTQAGEEHAVGASSGPDGHDHVRDRRASFRNAGLRRERACVGL